MTCISGKPAIVKEGTYRGFVTFAHFDGYDIVGYGYVIKDSEWYYGLVLDDLDGEWSCYVWGDEDITYTPEGEMVARIENPYMPCLAIVGSLKKQDRDLDGMRILKMARAGNTKGINKYLGVE